jgi:hypothetical protein
MHLRITSILHGDPADRFITATAIAHDATLITADHRLLRWRGKVKRQHANRSSLSGAALLNVELLKDPADKRCITA